MSYLYLGVAIACEILGTSMLKASDGFSRPVPTAVTVVAYVVAFYALSVALRGIPVGIAYALWSAIGIIAIAIIGRVAFGQSLDLPALVGLALIVAGVVTIQLWSKSTV